VIDTPHYPAADGWYYSKPTPAVLEGKDPRKLVELRVGGRRWIAIRTWKAEGVGGYWLNNGEPEVLAEVVAWRELPDKTRGLWDRGRFTLLPIATQCPECSYVWTDLDEKERHAPSCSRFA
jgi:Zn-finger nucleic acid-binding protein